MPLSGRGFTNSYSSSLGEEEMRVIASGINLFEVKPKSHQFFNDKIIGPWDAKVNEHFDAANRLIHTVRWFNQKSAYVEIKHYGKGKRFGCIPDDPVWHNRIVMLPLFVGNNAPYEIVNYHTQDGFFSGARILKELIYLRDLTHIWNVVNRKLKTIVHSSIDGEECDEYIRKVIEEEEQNEMLLLTKGGPVRFAETKKMSSLLQLQHTKKPEIMALVKKYSLGWYHSDEWTKEILPRIKGEIEERFGESEAKERRMPTAQLSPDLQLLAKLAEDKIFMEMLKKHFDTTSKDGEQQNAPENTTINVPVSEKVITETMPEGEKVIDTGMDLSSIPVAKLREIARSSYGIKSVNNKSRESLIGEINEKRGIPDQDGDADLNNDDLVDVDE